MKIHKEGYPSILITLALLVVLNITATYFWEVRYEILLVLYILSAFLFIGVVQFFRSPVREHSPDESYILCPADGKVVAIEEVEDDEYFNEKRLQVSIFMSPLNVHINWVPVSGIVKYLKYHPGKYLVAWHPKSSTDNERTTVVIETEKQITLLLRQIAGAMARRIVYYPKEGEKVNQGEQLGFIKFGSRVDLLLPLDIQLNVSLNEKVKGNKTIIGYFR